MDTMKPLPRKALPEQVQVLATLQGLDLPAEEWKKISSMITRYLAERAMDAMDEATKDWSDEDFERVLHEHYRTPYPAK